jgi:hypothetical protein
MSSPESPVELAKKIDLEVRKLSHWLGEIPQSARAAAATEFYLLHAKTSFLVKALGGVPIEQ